MHVRRLTLAAAVLACASVATAEPAKPEAREANANTSRPAAVVLASAEQPQTPAPANSEQAAAPVKRPRVGRVTTCRCGDQGQR
jgi:hypothetical protein